MSTRWPLAAMCLLLFGCYRATQPTPLPFWVKPGAIDQLGRESVNEDHPCDPVALVAVRRIPQVDDPLLDSELVIEFDEAGDLLESWRIPVDSDVAGIAGSELIVSVKQEPPETIFISPNGRFRLATPADMEDGRLIDCPALLEFGDSAFLRCREFRDSEDGRLRRLAYQGPCT